MVFNSSNGIYRSVHAALVGLVLIGTNVPNQPTANAIHTKTDDKVVSPTLPIDVGKPSGKPQDDGCKKGEDHRQSDLCAQWKAADAAANAALWSWWQMIGGFIGLLVGGGTLFFAARAAHWAKQAATETQKGADAAINAVDETRRANELAREAQRAWLIFDIKVIEIWLMGDQPTVKFDIIFENKGSSTTKIKSVLAYCHSCEPKQWHTVITEQMIRRMVDGHQPEKKVGDNYPTIIYRDAAKLRRVTAKLNGNAEPMQHVALLYLHVVYDVGRTVSAFTIRQSKGKFVYATIKPIDGGFTKLPLKGDELECEKHEYSYME
jgi:hypothetical protein